jgi:hypothetical protein
MDTSHSTDRRGKSPYVEPYIKGKITVRKLVPHAELPSIEREKGEFCWNIYAVGRKDNRSEDMAQDVNYFSTGLILVPPTGYFIEITAHDQLCRTGYMLMSPIIIGENNVDELSIPLYKFADGEDLSLPFIAVQMTLRKAIKVHLNAPSTRASSSRIAYPDFDVHSESTKLNFSSKRSNHMF